MRQIPIHSLVSEFSPDLLLSQTYIYQMSISESNTNIRFHRCHLAAEHRATVRRPFHSTLRTPNLAANQNMTNQNPPITITAYSIDIIVPAKVKALRRA